MFKGTGLFILVGILIVVSSLIIFLEWRAVRSLSHGGPGDGGGSTAAEEGFAGADSRELQAAQGDEQQQVANLRGRRSSTTFATAQNGLLTEELMSFPTPPEVRHPKCQGRKYDFIGLPTVTMVIPYLNETWAQIHKTLASVFVHTPMELLDEVLMVDDGNAPEWRHTGELTALHPKVRVLRNEERQGLIRAKVIGAETVKSPVIVFMEPHCIVNKQWLEPLLVQLAHSNGHSTIVMPVLDIIPEENFNEYRVANHHIGGFDWSLTFNWMAVITDRNKSYRLPAPYPTPALSGGIFGLWKDYWHSSGTYDTNMTEWGGEHIEMSLRTWRCGGRIEVVPCSRIGHVFRARNPYVVHHERVVRNEKRAALVWLDDYVANFYKEVPQARHLDAGDVQERLQLKEKLHCKSMQWYIENVYPELLKKQPRRR